MALSKNRLLHYIHPVDDHKELKGKALGAGRSLSLYIYMLCYVMLYYIILNYIILYIYIYIIIYYIKYIYIYIIYIYILLYCIYYYILYIIYMCCPILYNPPIIIHNPWYVHEFLPKSPRSWPKANLVLPPKLKLGGFSAETPRFHPFGESKIRKQHDLP